MVPAFMGRGGIRVDLWHDEPVEPMLTECLMFPRASEQASSDSSRIMDNLEPKFKHLENQRRTAL
jgi:hypothetical protein